MEARLGSQLKISYQATACSGPAAPSGQLAQISAGDDQWVSAFNPERTFESAPLFRDDKRNTRCHSVFSLLLHFVYREAACVGFTDAT